MGVVNYYIEKILKETSITDFLEERGIFPDRTSGDKLFYICPVHDGDKSPSFVVFPKGSKGKDYQTYHCFGCHSRMDLINLKSDLDGITMKESIRSFLKNIIIDDEEVLNSVIESIEEGEKEEDEQKQIESLLLLINHACKEHILAHNDEEERGFFDDFFKKVDRVARARDVETIEGVLELLIDKNGLEQRVKKFNERQEAEEMSSMAWRI